MSQGYQEPLVSATPIHQAPEEHASSPSQVQLRGLGSHVAFRRELVASTPDQSGTAAPLRLAWNGKGDPDAEYPASSSPLAQPPGPRA